MVYHEIRVLKGRKKHYLIYNSRKEGKWVKKSKVLGTGDISKKKIEEEKKKFKKEIVLQKEYIYLNKNDVKILEDIKEEYDKKINNLHKEEYKQFQKSFFTELTYNSNAIEGSSLSLQETALVLNEGIVPEGKTLREVYEARNHLKALEFLKKHKGDLDELFILKLHKFILTDISSRFAGRYRETDIRIFGADIKFPKAYKISQLVKNLVYWYKKNKKLYHPFELAVLVSMKLVTIHPFVDGNGRVSRLVMNFLLEKKKYPWVNIYNKKRQKYLEATRKANDEDYSLIFPLLIKIVRKNVEELGVMNIKN